jgi:hypothetical protein
VFEGAAVPEESCFPAIMLAIARYRFVESVKTTWKRP